MSPSDTHDPGLAPGIEVVRGRLSAERADGVRRFWAEQAGFTGDAAEERLGQVVCVLPGAGDVVEGVTSAYPARVPLAGGRAFWIYRSLIAPARHGAEGALISATFQALEAQFDPRIGGPIGLCLALGDSELTRDRPEVEWSDPRAIYVGHAADGRQVRVAYFHGARISDRLGPPTPPWEGSMDDSYAVEVFADQDVIGEEEVIDMWVREGAMDAREAHRRRLELHLVARHRDELAGVTTRYLVRHDQVGMDLWGYRGFVAPKHRHSMVALELARTSVADLERRWHDGSETRGAGILFEIENEGLKEVFDDALPNLVDFPFITENERGDHVRVHFFPGARVPGSA